jgi:hypothetical protein
MGTVPLSACGPRTVLGTDPFGVSPWDHNLYEGTEVTESPELKPRVSVS